MLFMAFDATTYSVVVLVFEVARHGSSWGLSECVLVYSVVGSVAAGWGFLEPVRRGDEQQFNGHESLMSPLLRTTASNLPSVWGQGTLVAAHRTLLYNCHHQYRVLL